VLFNWNQLVQTALVAERQDFIFSFLQILDALGLVFGVSIEERRGIAVRKLEIYALLGSFLAT
jgi:hypothetical protein